jgi:hypothetical protein
MYINEITNTDTDGKWISNMYKSTGQVRIKII